MLAVLRSFPLFALLSDEQLRWIIDHSTEIRLPAGELLFVEGNPALSFYVLLAGELQVTKHSGTQNLVLATHHTGAFTGEIPLLTGTPYIASAYVARDSHLLRMDAQSFNTMLTVCSPVASVLLPTIAKRVQSVETLTQQQTHLASLGKLSAGLAHELNNPAAAAQRATGYLRETIQVQQALFLGLNVSLPAEQLSWLVAFQQSILAKATQTAQQDALAQSDLEEVLTDWLDTHDIPESWKLSATFVGVGLGYLELEELADHLEAGALPQALAWLEAAFSLHELLDEVTNSTTRISDLVKAIKSYSYMDQAPLQEIDVHEGLESTLTILAYKLKRGVGVTREYDRSLPRISAYGSELNQVWTNLLDNAIDAMDGQGQITVRTAREGAYLLVEIADNGPGIPAEIQSRIFEPFFTTKGVGSGTGLGLDAVQRIVVNKHHGDISVSSQPGNTRFQIRLLLNA